jgi:hypothetical protein
VSFVEGIPVQVVVFILLSTISLAVSMFGSLGGWFIIMEPYPSNTSRSIRFFAASLLASIVLFAFSNPGTFSDIGLVYCYRLMASIAGTASVVGLPTALKRRRLDIVRETMEK